MKNQVFYGTGIGTPENWVICQHSLSLSAARRNKIITDISKKYICEKSFNNLHNEMWNNTFVKN